MAQQFHDEDGTLRHLVTRLAAAYPDIDAIVVEATVEDAGRDLSGARLKTFLPILTERKARQALDRYRATRTQGTHDGT
ncbi:hypothetical protein ABZW32_38435 [Streptomyces sp. NPDC004667]|uniref:three-helix bundle dimerization domain-containing protein n=1 Tax=Streptomyces sp. NPDC004667 TaxID=3154285 RepID=UPI0033A317F9